MKCLTFSFLFCFLYVLISSHPIEVCQKHSHYLIILVIQKKKTNHSCPWAFSFIKHSLNMVKAVVKHVHYLPETSSILADTGTRILPLISPNPIDQPMLTVRVIAIWSCAYSLVFQVFIITCNMQPNQTNFEMHYSLQ